MTQILFVSNKNLFRSPLAAVILVSKLRDLGLDDLVMVDSAGLTIGESDEKVFRTTILGTKLRKIASKKGYVLGDRRTRRVTQSDFKRFEYILAMNWEDLSAIRKSCPKKYWCKLHLIMRFAPNSINATVGMPQMDNLKSIEAVFKSIEDACRGLTEMIRLRSSKVA
ncbi:MAG: hypothetical protein CBC42_01050 [Betaproteobacteria bacterium TMED82]|nr:MAG: hypothetical protein CBC42_01050 [Betaproteobacteria bacterium TMED82]|tara:strand:- start:13571 stop:14071 length:501 start_codon:yes stop_codon:yes gene_type:complete